MICDRHRKTIDPDDASRVLSSDGTHWHAIVCACGRDEDDTGAHKPASACFGGVDERAAIARRLCDEDNAMGCDCAEVA